jgi:hypothetical protein
MPEAKVALKQASFGGTEPVAFECSIRDGIEALSSSAGLSDFITTQAS